MDSIVLLLIVALVISLTFIRKRVSLIVVYVLSAGSALYGFTVIFAALISEQNHLTPLAYMLGPLFILLALGLWALARTLYKKKQSKSFQGFEK